MKTQIPHRCCNVCQKEERVCEFHFDYMTGGGWYPQDRICNLCERYVGTCCQPTALKLCKCGRIYCMECSSFSVGSWYNIYLHSMYTHFISQKLYIYINFCCMIYNYSLLNYN